MTDRAYRISLSKAAIRDLEGLPKATQKKVDKKLQTLAQDPRPDGVKALQGRLAGCWRVRAGKHRIIYEIRDELRLVLVQRIRDRSEAYR